MWSSGPSTRSDWVAAARPAAAPGRSTAVQRASLAAAQGVRVVWAEHPLGQGKEAVPQAQRPLRAAAVPFVGGESVKESQVGVVFRCVRCCAWIVTSLSAKCCRISLPC